MCTVSGVPHMLQVMGYVQCLVTHIIVPLMASSTASKDRANISWRPIVWGTPSPSVLLMMLGVQEHHHGQKLWPSRYEESCPECQPGASLSTWVPLWQVT